MAIVDKTTKVVLCILAVVITPSLFTISLAMPNEDIKDVEKTHINKLGNAFGERYLKWIDEDNPKTKQQIKKQMDNIVSQLERYGITYTEKYDKDPSYWAEISSRHLDGSGNIKQNGLQWAHAAANPYFYLGYFHDCWWILACPEWDDEKAQLGWNEKITIFMDLVSDHSWSEPHYKVTGSGLVVNFLYAVELKNGQVVKQQENGVGYAIFYTDTINIQLAAPKYYDSKDAWHYEIEYLVTNII